MHWFMLNVFPNNGLLLPSHMQTQLSPQVLHLDENITDFNWKTENILFKISNKINCNC